jgi:hypothetical protein
MYTRQGDDNSEHDIVDIHGSNSRSYHQRHTLALSNTIHRDICIQKRANDDAIYNVVQIMKRKVNYSLWHGYVHFFQKSITFR